MNVCSFFFGIRKLELFFHRRIILFRIFIHAFIRHFFHVDIVAFGYSYVYFRLDRVRYLNRNSLQCYVNIFICRNKLKKPKRVIFLIRFA